MRMLLHECADITARARVGPVLQRVDQSQLNLRLISIATMYIRDRRLQS